MIRPASLRLAVLGAASCAVLPAARAGAQHSGPATPTPKSAALVPAPLAATAPVASGTPTAPATDADVERVVVAPGRSRPLTLGASVTRVVIADTSVADALVVSDRDVVFTGRKFGESDVLVWSGGRRLHYRAVVTPAADRQQVMLAVKFAEVRRDLLKNVGVSVRARRFSGGAVSGASVGSFNHANGFDPAQSATDIVAGVAGNVTGFGTLVTDFGARGLLAMLDLEEERGNAHTLAEPTLMAGNRDSAAFLAGGEFPIPAASTVGPNGVPFITIVFKEFGVRLSFTPEVLNDTLVKLHVRPEVSSLDYNNAVELSGGVRVPALRTRRLESTIDVPRDQSLVISGLMDDERQKVRTGVPGLINLPILGSLFSSTRWQRNETELIVVVTPVVVDPSRPRPQDVLRFKPDSTLPAGEALKPRLVTPPSTSPAQKQP